MLGMTIYKDHCWSGISALRELQYHSALPSFLRKPDSIMILTHYLKGM